MSATPTPPGEAEDEATVVVDRGEDDSTVVVEREDESTVVVERAPAKPRKTKAATTPVAESTDSELVEVTDSASASSSASSSTSVSASKFSESTSNSSGPMLKVPARSRSRVRPELRPAPVPSGFGRAAQEAIGVGAIMSYDSVASVPVVATGHSVGSGTVPTRAAAPSMPSVERTSRRTAIISLAVVAGACAISLGGLIALIAALVAAR